MADILVDDLSPGVRRITLNRPQSLNAFTGPMYLELLEILGSISHDPSARVVVITGAGRGFCAGHDNVTPSPSPWVAKDIGKVHLQLQYMAPLNRVTSTIRSMPQAVIAALNGSVAGVGYSMALACDMAIAAKSAKFVNAFHNAGSGSEVGLSYFLPRAVGAQRAAELLLTARPVLADEAEHIGLVLKTVPDDQLMNTVLEIANNVIANAPLDVWLTKQNMYNNLHVGSLEQAITFETRALAMVNQTEDAQEKRNARKEKREPKFSSR